MQSLVFESESALRIFKECDCRQLLSREFNSTLLNLPIGNLLIYVAVFLDIAGVRATIADRLKAKIVDVRQFSLILEQDLRSPDRMADNLIFCQFRRIREADVPPVEFCTGRHLQSASPKTLGKFCRRAPFL
ncbi:MAG: hypothetical protein WBA89_12410 [Microcoleus sp.]|uniref:hypothetical protein n=1 Tax=Microcoleus sp. TaxID=44472 RepID=UPI003C742FFE